VETVHVFVAHGRFGSDAELQAFIDPASTHDGDMLPSPFMRETGCSEYEPACIERVHSPALLPVRELLRGASYAAQWLHQLDASLVANSAICVFAPNTLDHPQRTSMQYVGAFPYRVTST
jgi:hypothetical protein